jgi:hypothetical protein
MDLIDFLLQGFQLWFAHITSWILGTIATLFDLCYHFSVAFWLWVAAQLPSAIGTPLAGAITLLTGPTTQKMVSVGLWLTSSLIDPGVLLAGAGWVFTVFMVSMGVRVVFWVVSLAWPGAGAGG